MKKCSACGKELPDQLFYTKTQTPRKKTYVNLQSKCKPCAREAARLYSNLIRWQKSRAG